jgi:hypothetical protein
MQKSKVKGQNRKRLQLQEIDLKIDKTAREQAIWVWKVNQLKVPRIQRLSHLVNFRI